MQTIAMHQEPSALVLGMPAFGGKLYATQPGVDHPTPPAPDRGGKKKPKAAPKKKKKK
jgi:hypothetical protein